MSYSSQATKNNATPNNFTSNSEINSAGESTKAQELNVKVAIDEYLSKQDWRLNENSNEDYSFSGLLLHTAGKAIAKYSLNEIYTKEIREAHLKGYIHIHDLSNGFVGYCAGWSLKNLLLKGGLI